MQELEVRVCPYCETEFAVKPTSRKKYCKRTCSVYASQERNGRRKKATINETDISRVGTVISQKSISAQSKVTNEAKAKYDRLSKELFAIHNNSLKNQKRQINQQLATINSIEDKSVQQIESIRQLQSQLTTINKTGERMKEKEMTLPDKIIESYFKYEKELNKLKTLKLKGFKSENDTLITANSINKILLYTCEYDFEHFAVHKNFELLGFDNSTFPLEVISPLGKVNKPFTAMLYGDKMDRLIDLSIYLAGSLREVYKTKVLYLLDEEQDEFSFFQKLKAKENELQIFHPDIAIQKVKARGDVEKVVKEFVCEFLFIYDVQRLRVDKAFIRKLHLEHSSISIFCISENSIKTISNIAHIVYQCSTDKEGFEKRKVTSSDFNDWFFL